MLSGFWGLPDFYDQLAQSRQIPARWPGMIAINNLVSHLNLPAAGRFVRFSKVLNLENDSELFSQYYRKECSLVKVFIQFIVETDGCVREIKVIKGVGLAYDEEVIRVLNLMPSWKPGAINGHPSRMKMMMPITFR